jgi:NitT/TauT family transport system permease protein
VTEQSASGTVGPARATWWNFRQLSRKGKSLVLLLAVLLLWEAAIDLFAVPRYLLPSPSNIVLKLAASPELFAYHALVTTRETLEGFAFAVLVGVALATIIVHSRMIEETLYPILIFMQLTPKMAIAPLLIVWLGFGETPKIAIAFLIAFFPIVISTVAGLRSVEPEQLEMLRGLRANNWQILLKARFPSALPFLFSAMRISITLAVTGAIVAEFVGASEGLGHLIIVSSSNMETETTFAAILTLAAIGVVLFSLIRLVEYAIDAAHGGHVDQATTA